MSFPSRTIFPLWVNPGERSFKRLSERRKVVLPLLAGPMIARRSLGRISRSRLFRAGWPSKEAVKPCTRMVVVAVGMAVNSPCRLDREPSHQRVGKQIQRQDGDDEHRRRCIGVWHRDPFTRK